MKKIKTKKKLKKRTKRILWGTGAVLALALAGGGYYAYQNFIPHKVGFDKNATAQSNFYQYINKDYLAKAKISKDKSTQGATDELQDKADKQVMADLDDLVAKKKSTQVTGMDVVTDYYALATNSKTRNKNGTKPAKKYLKQLDAINNLSQLSQSYQNLTMQGWFYRLTFPLRLRIRIPIAIFFVMTRQEVFFPTLAFTRIKISQSNISRPTKSRRLLS